MAEVELPNLLWVDIETTGLNPDDCLPLEIAVVVTNSDLEEIYANSWLINWEINLGDLDEWPLKTHMTNGLLLDVTCKGRDIDEVRADLNRFMRRSDIWPNFLDGDDRPPLCGSSINFEREWLQLWFPDFYSRIHYRSIDVSSIKELMRRWLPNEAISRRETSKHRAMDDILDSITELKHYRDVLDWRDSFLVLDAHVVND